MPIVVSYRLRTKRCVSDPQSRNLYNWLSEQIDVEQRPGEEGALRRLPPRGAAAAATAGPQLRLLYVPSVHQTPFSQLFRQLAGQPPRPPPAPSPPHELPTAGQLPPFCSLHPATGPSDVCFQT